MAAHEVMRSHHMRLLLHEKLTQGQRQVLTQCVLINLFGRLLFLFSNSQQSMVVASKPCSDVPPDAPQCSRNRPCLVYLTHTRSTQLILKLCSKISSFQ